MISLLRSVFAVASITLHAHAAAQPAPAAISLVRDMRIDGVAANLVTPSWILVMREGRIAVSQAQDRSLSIFDSSGRLVGKFGRSGQGPGEFQTLGTAGLVGDSLWILATPSRRLTIMSPNLSYAREITDRGARPGPGTEGAFPSAAQAVPYAIYGDGTMLVRPTLQQTQEVPAGYDRTGITFLRLASDGVIRARVARIVEHTGAVSVGGGIGSFASASTPFYARTITQVSDRGGRIAALSCVYDGSQARTMHLVVISGGGDTVFARNYPFAAVPVPATVRDSVRTAMIQMVSRRGGAASTELAAAIRDRMTVPTFYPPYGSLLIADDGTIWVGLRSGQSSTVTSFLVIDKAGNIVGTASPPPNTRPMAISATSMWGIELDQDDVPSIVRYRVVR